MCRSAGRRIPVNKQLRGEVTGSFPETIKRTLAAGNEGEKKLKRRQGGLNHQRTRED